MCAAVHLAISYYGREVLAHDAIEIRLVGMSVGLEEVRIVVIFVHQGFLGHAFLHHLHDVVQQPFTKRWILFGLVSHLLWRGCAFYPELWTNISACTSGRGEVPPNECEGSVVLDTLLCQSDVPVRRRLLPSAPSR